LHSRYHPTRYPVCALRYWRFLVVNLLRVILTYLQFLKSCNGSLIHWKHLRRKLSKLSIVGPTIGDSYWIVPFTIDPYYRDTRYRNTSIFRCIGPPLLVITQIVGDIAPPTWQLVPLIYVRTHIECNKFRKPFYAW